MPVSLAVMNLIIAKRYVYGLSFCKIYFLATRHLSSVRAALLKNIAITIVKSGLARVGGLGFEGGG